MDDTIPWKDINLGHQGFENLANEYVQDVFAQYKWNPTQKTRDNNHDGYAIVTCFSQKMGTYEIWMEAKYSSTKTFLTRYRLDSTIVSAIINQNIKKLFFVTNIEIADYVRQAIRSALVNALDIKYNDVQFCTKLNLEIWLSQPKNKDRLHYYFSKVTSLKNICKSKDIQLIGLPHFYRYIKHQLSYQYPLKKIYTSELYRLCFQVYSPINKEVEINSLSQNFQILFPREKIILQTGSNDIELIVKCKYCKELANAFQIDNKIINLDSISVCKNQNIRISICSQQKHLRLIKKSLNKFLSKKESIIHILWGLPYTGKSYIIQNLLLNNKLYDEDVLYYTFDIDLKNNSDKILDFCLKIYFYLFDTNEIDEEYLSSINNKYNYIPYLIRELVKKRDTSFLFDQIDNIKKRTIFNREMNVTRKTIFLDRIEYLSFEQNSFLKKAIYELYISETPVFILIAGRNKFWLNFNDFPNIISHHLYTDFRDFYATLELNNIKISSSLAILIHSKIPKFIDLLNFIRYIKANVKGKHDEISLMKIIYNFKSDDLYKQYVKQIFTEIETNRPVESDLLHIIYFSLSGFPIENIKNEYHSKAVEYLLEYELIKISLGKLYPINDIYQDIYRIYYSNKQNSLIDDYKLFLNRDELMRYYISQCSIKYPLKSVLNIISSYSQKQNFLLINYLLNSIFDTNCLYDFYKYDPDYYYLKFYYIYSLSNINPDFNSFDAFVDFYKQISYSNLQQIDILKFNTLAEIVNFAFVDLKVILVFEYINEFRLVYNDNPISFKVDASECSLLVDEIEVLTYALIDQYDTAEKLYRKLIEKCRICNNITKEGIIHLRYARSLFHNQLEYASALLQQAHDKLSNSSDKKWLLLCDIDILYINQLRGNKMPNDIRTKMDFSEKNITTTYKAYLRYQIAQELKLGNINKFCELYFEYQTLHQIHSSRSRGINYLFEAAYYYLRKEYIKSAEKLILQASEFSLLGRSYQDIIQHNLKLVNSSTDSQECYIDYYIGYVLKNNVFYLDPRLW